MSDMLVTIDFFFAESARIRAKYVFSFFVHLVKYFWVATQYWFDLWFFCAFGQVSKKQLDQSLSL